MANTETIREDVHSKGSDSEEVLHLFAELGTDPTWSFSELTTRHTRYATHGYHTYPAKFIPQLAARLIRELTRPGQWVLDPFMGSGTTLVEAKVLGRPSLGVDINPVAHLISLSKTRPVDPDLLSEEIVQFDRWLSDDQAGQLSFWSSMASVPSPDHERIDYWFEPEKKDCLAKILHLIETKTQESTRPFFRCAFSNSLKTSSIWLQRSTKPTRDLAKVPPDPRETFLKNVRRMAKGNKVFFDLLEKSGNVDTPAEPYCADARNLPCEDGQLSLVVTSPPYVTSYEYADLHQLSALWFEQMTDLPSFRRRFIGTAYHEEREPNCDSKIADTIVDELSKEKKKTADEVANYFTEMREVFSCLKKKLKRRGRACIVVGNTNLLGVDILNAEVFSEQLLRLGFELERVIDRVIPSKILPQVRDKSTGRFTSKLAADFQAYPHEYILIARKK